MWLPPWTADTEPAFHAPELMRTGALADGARDLQPPNRALATYSGGQAGLRNPSSRGSQISPSTNSGGRFGSQKPRGDPSGLLHFWPVFAGICALAVLVPALHDRRQRSPAPLAAISSRPRALSRGLAGERAPESGSQVESALNSRGRFPANPACASRLRPHVPRCGRAGSQPEGSRRSPRTPSSSPTWPPVAAVRTTRLAMAMVAFRGPRRASRGPCGRSAGVGLAWRARQEPAGASRSRCGPRAACRPSSCSSRPTA